jgi:hypothetical protein
MCWIDLAQDRDECRAANLRVPQKADQFWCRCTKWRYLAEGGLLGANNCNAGASECVYGEAVDGTWNGGQWVMCGCDEDMARGSNWGCLPPFALYCRHNLHKCSSFLTRSSSGRSLSLVGHKSTFICSWHCSGNHTSSLGLFIVILSQQKLRLMLTTTMRVTSTSLGDAPRYQWMRVIREWRNGNYKRGRS